MKPRDITAAVAAVGLSLVARADTIEDPALELARTCQYEAAWSRSDCAAIFYVVSKRAQALARQWIDVLHAYSQLYSGDGARKTEIRSYPWADVDGKSAVFNDRWADQRTYTLDILLGVVADPCPDAVHWGGQTDPQPARFEQVRCRRPTVNRFYKLKPRAATKASGGPTWALARLGGRMLDSGRWRMR